MEKLLNSDFSETEIHIKLYKFKARQDPISPYESVLPLSLNKLEYLHTHQ